MKPVVIIISGPSASGKTQIGRTIAEKIKLPFVSKDDIKELLFDHVGWKDVAWSRKLGETTYRLFDYIGGALLKAGQSFIFEADFRPDFDRQRFQGWQQQYNIKLIEVHCRADHAVLK